jgi:hypothetical protein
MIEQEDFVDRGWELHDQFTNVICEGEFTNGDLLFVMSVLIADLVKYEDLDFNELMKDLQEMSLINIKIMSDA